MTAVLDDVLPAYNHRERHSTTVAAPPTRVWAALHAVTGAELGVTRLLMGVRMLPARLAGAADRTPPSAPRRPFVATFLERGLRELRSEPPRALVVGGAGQPWRLDGGERADVRDIADLRAFAQPGFVLMATSFELERDGDRTRLATETRVQPTDPGAARSFRPYWWAIRAGSGLIRRDMLRAIRRRAERPV